MYFTKGKQRAQKAPQQSRDLTASKKVTTNDEIAALQ